MFDMTGFAAEVFELKWSEDVTLHILPPTLTMSYKIQYITLSSDLDFLQRLLEVDYIIINNNVEKIEISREEIQKHFSYKEEMLESFNTKFSEWLEKAAAKKN